MKSSRSQCATRALGPRHSFVLLALFTSFAFFTSLPHAKSQQVPTFRTRTDLVELDVSVLDGNRRPVRGLTKDDFVVMEDGKPQTVSVFDAVDVPDAVTPPVAWMRDVTPDVDTNETKVTRLWVVVVDDALIPTDPYAITTSLKVVREIIDKFGPNDMAAIVFTTDSRKAQDFTNDRTKLLAALNQFNPGWANWTAPPKGQKLNPDWQFQSGAVRTLQNIMDTISALPHHRKALIWVSAGLSGGFRSPLLENPTGFDADDAARLQSTLSELQTLNRLREAWESGQRANVPIYSIHPCGLKAPGDASKCGAAASGAFSLIAASMNTGGTAITDTNDYSPGINRIFEENGSYYLLGYSPTNTKTDGKLRKLEVVVNRPGLMVRTRTMYTAPKKVAAPPKDVNEALGLATAVPLAVTDLPMRATAAPFAIPGKNVAAVALALEMRQAVPPDVGAAGASFTTDLQINAYTTEGDKKATERSVARVTLRPGTTGEADYETLSRIELPPGRFRLRVAAVQESTGKSGTVMVDVIVPDFARDPASISGVVINAEPARPSAPRDIFVKMLPVVPTAQRSFRPADLVWATFNLYQTGSDAALPANVAIRIVNDKNETLIEEQKGIEAAKFAAPAGSTTLRAAEFQYGVPTDRLAPGSYLLTFDVTVGARKLSRNVQFQVR